MTDKASGQILDLPTRMEVFLNIKQFSHFSQTIGALVSVSPADSPLIAKTVPTFRRRASSVAGNSNDDYILGIGRELAIRQPKSQKLAN